MKKYLFIAVIAMSFCVCACGNSTKTTNDSTSVDSIVVDSTATDSVVNK